MPGFFLGLAAPADLSPRITAWQAGFGHHITAPHVTLRAPVGPGEGLGLDWWPAVQASCARRAPFEAQLTGVQTFKARGIFLAVDSTGARDLHLALLDALDTATSPQEGAGHTPHLTLALNWRLLNAAWPEVLASARAAFVGLEVALLSFTASPPGR